MEKRIRNIEHATVLALVDQVACQPGQIVSKTLAQNSYYSLTLFAFDKGEEIGTHDSNGDALVTTLEGTARVTINGTDFTLNTGESITCLQKSLTPSLRRNASRCSCLFYSPARNKLQRSSPACRGSFASAASPPPNAISSFHTVLSEKGTTCLS